MITCPQAPNDNPVFMNPAKAQTSTKGVKFHRPRDNNQQSLDNQPKDSVKDSRFDFSKLRQTYQSAEGQTQSVVIKLLDIVGDLLERDQEKDRRIRQLENLIIG